MPTYDAKRMPEPITERACRAHSRRKFFGLAKLAKAPIAIEAVDRIDELFQIERAERGMRYDLSRGGDGLSVPILSTFGLEAQIGSDGASWLDRELTSPNRTPFTKAGFGRDVATALERRKQSLVERGYVSRRTGGAFITPADLLS